MNTVNTGDMMKSNVKSSKIAAADGRYLLTLFFVCLVFSFSKRLKRPVRTQKHYRVKYVTNPKLS